MAAGVGTLIKAVSAENLSVESLNEHEADIVMLDAPTPGGGIPFDWDVVGELVNGRRILLAGGLRPGNVAQAILQVRPWGVDVASGVEALPGQKDRRKLIQFVTSARSAARPRDKYGKLTEESRS